MNWLKSKLAVIARLLRLTRGASIDLSRTNEISKLRKQITQIQKDLSDVNIKIKAMSELQEEFKENFVRHNKLHKSSTATVNLAAEQINSLAKTQTLIATEVVRINTSLDELVESLIPPGSEIDLRFFTDDDIYN